MEIFKHTASLLSKGESFALVTILARSGPAPRSAGTRMIVRSDGTIIGSVGGGSLEAEALGAAGEVLKGRGTLRLGFVLSPQDTDGLGMICGGQVELLAAFVDAADESELIFYRTLLDALAKNEKHWLIIRLPRDEQSPPEQCLISKGGWLAGSLCNYEELLALVGQAGRRKTAFVVEGGYEYLVQRLENPGTVYIFGAGHVGRSVASLARVVGFRVVLLDDREEFANARHMDKADEIIVLDSFEQSFTMLEIDRNSYIVIVTRGHAFDSNVLEFALKTDAGYIGMIGSRKKRDAIYGILRRKGLQNCDLTRVHSPIGISIEAETPEEIAVSIVAELIKTRADKANAPD